MQCWPQPVMMVGCCLCVTSECVVWAHCTGNVRIWGKEKTAHRQRQMQASSEHSALLSNGSSQVLYVLHSSTPHIMWLSHAQDVDESRGEWVVGEDGGEGEGEGLEGAASASSLASEQLEESLSAASLAEVGSDWQLAVDSLTSSMDSSVGVHQSLPSLSAPPPPPPSNQLAAGTEEEQVTGQSGHMVNCAS